MTPNEFLLSCATKKELLNSLNAAFDELVTSENFTQFTKKDRVRLVFHWELFRDFLTDVEDTRNEILSEAKKN